MVLHKIMIEIVIVIGLKKNIHACFSDLKVVSLLRKIWIFYGSIKRSINSVCCLSVIFTRDYCALQCDILYYVRTSIL